MHIWPTCTFLKRQPHVHTDGCIPTPKSMASSPRSPPPAPTPEFEISRQSRLFAALSKKVIDLDELRMLAAQGVPDAAGVRATVWKLLLGYLPNDRSLWEQELAKKRGQYAAFKDEFLTNPVERAQQVPTEGHHNVSAEHVDNGFLHRSEYSEIMEQIDRDVKRTHPDMQFFCGDSSFAKSNQESLKNVLLIFAKLNAGIRYVQGMNEVLAPLFFVFRSDPDDKNAEFAEADSFFCFVELLSGFRDNFCQKLDNSAVGIRGTLAKLSQLVAKYDGELQQHLEITTEEFNFADTIHIWDTLLSDPGGPQETLLRICCAMLILVRKRLLAGDFTSNLKLLQNYPPTNISHLLYVANKLH
ncbi:Ypt/Rab-GAP domain of gyp1p superfamily protein [Zea mays]|uniref:Ypt/Rab-GAP domain of gyp1p superfamily protein n=1 Tax=Zea mays TaxID=4577 RepID=A0A1D6G6R8_MAIZE|nr:Ypt/Rab-GAP domain of gyp1p superfamily protein [Zea mays]